MKQASLTIPAHQPVAVTLPNTADGMAVRVIGAMFSHPGAVMLQEFPLQFILNLQVLVLHTTQHFPLLVQIASPSHQEESFRQATLSSVAPAQADMVALTILVLPSCSAIWAKAQLQELAKARSRD